MKLIKCIVCCMVLVALCLSVKAQPKEQMLSDIYKACMASIPWTYDSVIIISDPVSFKMDWEDSDNFSKIIVTQTRYGKDSLLIDSAWLPVIFRQKGEIQTLSKIPPFPELFRSATVISNDSLQAINDRQAYPNMDDLTFIPGYGRYMGTVTLSDIFLFENRAVLKYSFTRNNLNGVTLLVLMRKNKNGIWECVFCRGISQA